MKYCGCTILTIDCGTRPDDHVFHSKLSFLPDAGHQPYPANTETMLQSWGIIPLEFQNYVWRQMLQKFSLTVNIIVYSTIPHSSDR